MKGCVVRMKLEDAMKLQDRTMRDMSRQGTLLVHLYGGPGTGKSTTRALAFGDLKQRGRNIEEAPEYAKEIVWEEALGKLGYQPYIIGKQMWRLRRLEDKVEAILTDTSTLLALIYGDEGNGVTPAFKEWLVDDYKRRNTLDFFLTRDPEREYNPQGRTQKTLAEAEQADLKIRWLLDDLGIDYYTIQVDKHDNSHVKEIVDKVENVLDLYTESGLKLAPPLESHTKQLEDLARYEAMTMFNG